MKKIIKAIPIFVCIHFMMYSCGQSAAEKAKTQVAEDLGLDKSDLETQSYYTFTIKDGKLKGKEFVAPNYISIYDGFKADENNNVALTSVTFVDPKQGNSTASISWDGTESKPLTADPASGDGTFLEFKIKQDETYYHFTSISGTTKVNSYKDVEVKDEMMDHTFKKRDVKLGFEGVFKENNSGDKYELEGIINYKNIK